MPDGRPYPGGAVYELLRALEGKRRKNVPDILVYRKVADTGISVTDADQRRVMTSQLDAFEAFWRQWFVSDEGYFRAGFQQFTTSDGFEHLLEQHLRAWLDEHGLLGHEVVWHIGERGSPFRGLEPYEPQHAEVFFGREREVDRGRERLLAAAEGRTAFLLIIGPSGSGKSSLARAGLLTRLTRPGDVEKIDILRSAVMRPSEAATPQRALAEAMFRLAALPELAAGDYREPEQLAAVLDGEPEIAIVPVLRALDRVSTNLRDEKSYDRPVEARLLLVIDQLEELFATTVDDAARTAFVRIVAALARSGRVLVIGTLRSSSYGEFAREPGLAALKDAGATLDVAVPGPEVLAEIVRRPAAAAGLVFERPGDRSLDEVLLEAAGGNTDALPLLGFTLQWLFEHREGERLTNAAYDELGGLEGAIGRAAEQAFGSVDHDAQASLPQLLRGLAEASRLGGGLALRDMPLAAAPESTPMRRLADALVGARVLLVHRPAQSAMLRLAHDAVLRGWARARDIIDKEQDFYRIRDEVSAAAQRWRDQRRNDLLLAPGLPLAEAQSLRRTYATELTPEILSYIDASARKDQSRQRRGYALAGVFGLVALSAVAAGIFAWHQQQIAEDQSALARAETARAEQNFAQAERERQRAEENLAQADRERKRAEQNLAEVEQQRNQTLLTQSQYLASLVDQRVNDDDASTGILLALEALPDVRSDFARPYAAEAERALYGARRRLHQTIVLAGQSAAFSPDGRRVVAASDEMARILEADTGREIAILRRRELAILKTGYAAVSHAAFSPDGRRVVTASYDRTAQIWDADTGEPIKALIGSGDRLMSAAFSPDGERVVTACMDNTATIWEVATGNMIMILRGHGEGVTSAAFSPDGQRVVTASMDHTAHIWNAATGQSITVLAGHSSEVSSAAFSPDGRSIVTASSDNTARIWDATTGQMSLILSGHGAAVRSAAFSPDNQRIVTASNDKTARIWSATGQSIAILKAHSREVYHAEFSPDGERVVTASPDQTVRIWAATPRPVLFGKLAKRLLSIAFSPDGGRFVTASADFTARIWDAKSHQTIIELKGHTRIVRSAAFSPDGRRIVTGSDDKTARIWDAETGQMITVLEGHKQNVTSVAFSPDGRRVVTADYNPRIWDADTGKTITVFDQRMRFVNSVAFSPDGRRVVTASNDRTARIWDADTGKMISLKEGLRDQVQSAVFSSDGGRVVTAHFDGPALIWNADTGKTIMVLEANLHGAAFSPDGRRVLTTGFRTREFTGGVSTTTWNEARIWDSETGKTTMILDGHQDSTYVVAAFGPDGRSVVTAGDDGMSIWPVFPTTQELVDDTRKTVAACLTSEQRKLFFLNPEPPTWCIEMAKWPYNTETWQSWLAKKKAVQKSPLPGTRRKRPR
jgi:WD40 repeat protein